MNKIKTIICLIAFVFVSAASAEQYIEVRTMREVKQVFTHYASQTLLLSATTQSVKKLRLLSLNSVAGGRRYADSHNETRRRNY